MSTAHTMIYCCTCMCHIPELLVQSVICRDGIAHDLETLRAANAVSITKKISHCTVEEISDEPEPLENIQ